MLDWVEHSFINQLTVHLSLLIYFGYGILWILFIYPFIYLFYLCVCDQFIVYLLIYLYCVHKLV